MRRLSRNSFPQSSHHNNQMLDRCLSTDISQTVVSDSDTSSIDESKPPLIPPPPPPNPPPRRRRKQTSIFYSSTPSLLSANEEVSSGRPLKRPLVPPPIPPRSVSISGESSHKCFVNEDNERFSQNDSSIDIFSKDELIDNLTQNLSVMEELNQSLRNKLKESQNENSILVNEVAAIRIERNQLLQTCKEIDTLKDNEWVCSICLDDRQLIVDTERQIVATFCGHLFCNVCINMALGLESVCPTCRKPVTSHPKKPPYIFLYF